MAQSRQGKSQSGSGPRRTGSPLSSGGWWGPSNRGRGGQGWETSGPQLVCAPARPAESSAQQQNLLRRPFLRGAGTCVRQSSACPDWPSGPASVLPLRPPHGAPPELNGEGRGPRPASRQHPTHLCKNVRQCPHPGASREPRTLFPVVYQPREGGKEPGRCILCNPTLQNTSVSA